MPKRADMLPDADGAFGRTYGRVRAWARAMRGAKTPAVALVAVAACALGVSDADAELVSYTDAQGVVHFSSKHKGAGHGVKGTSHGHRPGISPLMPNDPSLERFTRYDEWIHQAAQLYQIPEELVRAIIKCESDYDPRVVSPTGALGLMQLMPATAARMQVRDAFDPRENIFGGTRYLRVLANMFNGDLELTVAGYNAGEGAVVRYSGVPPFEETQGYVARVLTYYRRYHATNDPGAASR